MAGPIKQKLSKLPSMDLRTAFSKSTKEIHHVDDEKVNIANQDASGPSRPRNLLRKVPPGELVNTFNKSTQESKGVDDDVDQNASSSSGPRKLLRKVSSSDLLKRFSKATVEENKDVDEDGDQHALSGTVPKGLLRKMSSSDLLKRFSKVTMETMAVDDENAVAQEQERFQEGLEYDANGIVWPSQPQPPPPVEQSRKRHRLSVSNLLSPLVPGKRVKLNNGDAAQRALNRHSMINYGPAPIDGPATEKSLPRLRRMAKRSSLGLFLANQFGHDVAADPADEAEAISPGTIGGPEYGRPAVVVGPMSAGPLTILDLDYADESPEIPARSAQRALVLHGQDQYPSASDSQDHAERAHEQYMTTVQRAGAMARVRGTGAVGAANDIQRDLDQLHEDPAEPYEPISRSRRQRAATCLGCETKEQQLRAMEWELDHLVTGSAADPATLKINFARYAYLRQQQDVVDDGEDEDQRMDSVIPRTTQGLREYWDRNAWNAVHEGNRAAQSAYKAIEPAQNAGPLQKRIEDAWRASGIFEDEQPQIATNIPKNKGKARVVEETAQNDRRLLLEAGDSHVADPNNVPVTYEGKGKGRLLPKGSTESGPTVAIDSVVTDRTASTVVAQKPPGEQRGSTASTAWLSDELYAVIAGLKLGESMEDVSQA